MKQLCMSRKAFLWLAFLSLPPLLYSQGTTADYERAGSLRFRVQGLAVNVPERAVWIEGTSRFWYRRSVKGGNQFILADAEKAVKGPAFDHAKAAAALGAASGKQYEAETLPFQSITFVDKEQAIEFVVGNHRWKCDCAGNECRDLGPVPPGQRGGRSEEDAPDASIDDLNAEPLDPAFQQERPSPREEGDTDVKLSPDGTLEAFIRNYNVWIRPRGSSDAAALSYDGSEGRTYTPASLTWSPDSQKLAACRIRPGYHRRIQYVESSPADQLQPKYPDHEYPKPGDAIDIREPVLFDVKSRKQFVVDNRLFPNPYTISYPVWRKDSHAFTFEYNQRGHQAFRIIEVDGSTGAARAVVNEEVKTFFCYYSKKYRYDVADGKEVIWMSERDGWNHLYLYDGTTGDVENQITRGSWVVRGVDKVDEAARQIWFRASGMNPGGDPYLIHYYRINFDGSGLTPLTEADGNHSVVFSPDMRYYVDTWSRVDLPPVSELRATEDRRLIMELERADISELLKTGWRMPEVFSSPGRDGNTGIWGIIIRPTNFDPSKKYPVIEYIYAGPHDSFVPKSFGIQINMQSQADLGFIVAQIDGMGTSNRSKAFHDVAWKNLADAGFPDRILWHKAVAAKYPYYDITRVGIYGHSAGGQNALGALLFHPEFYDAAVSSCGCHDNRMDKISWNEQWMGWPVGPEYSACSNVDNAYRLQGKLLLSVGELDTNVDPASTMQVVDALIKAGKTFDLIVLPGQGHSTGGTYGERKRFDFFVRNLLHVDPPEWNQPNKQP